MPFEDALSHGVVMRGQGVEQGLMFVEDRQQPARVGAERGQRHPLLPRAKPVIHLDHDVVAERGDERAMERLIELDVFADLRRRVGPHRLQQLPRRSRHGPALAAQAARRMRWVQAETAAGTVNLQLNRGLTSYAPDGKLRGELAEHWERDGDAGWVFTLRDATFHNGAKVTSGDVKYTLEQIAAPRSTAYMKTQFQGVDRIETPNPRTVRIIMKQPTATLPEWLAAFEMPVVAAGSADSGKTPVGCGPFTLAAQERGVSLDLEAFPGFYKPGLPKLKTLRMVVYSDETARVAALQTGDVDLIEYVPWQSMAAIAANPKLKLETIDGPFMYMLFNGAAGPFADPRVRLAVAHAIKRDEIVKSVFYDRGSVLAGVPIVKSSPYYDASLADGWAYDPAKAKALLAEAGLAVRVPVGLVRFQDHLGRASVQRRDAVGEHEWASPPRTGRINDSPVALGAPGLGIDEPPLVPEPRGRDVHPAQLHQRGRVPAGKAHPDGVVVHDLHLDVAGEVEEGARRVRVRPFLHLVEGELEHLGVVGFPVLEHGVAAQRQLQRFPVHPPPPGGEAGLADALMVHPVGFFHGVPGDGQPVHRRRVHHRHRVVRSPTRPAPGVARR